MDLSDVVLDPELAEPYTILRSNGQFGAGGWQEQRISIPGFGVVSTISPDELQQVPEGDRISASNVFYSSQPLFESTRDNAGNAMTSDVLKWKGQQYRVVKVWEYSSRGFWKAAGARMSGQ